MKLPLFRLKMIIYIEISNKHKPNSILFYEYNVSAHDFEQKWKKALGKNPAKIQVGWLGLNPLPISDSDCIRCLSHASV